jgi:hypothetical protein
MAISYFNVFRCAKEARANAEQLSQLCGHALSLPPEDARRVHEQVEIAAKLLRELETILGKAICAKK